MVLRQRIAIGLVGERTFRLCLREKILAKIRHLAILILFIDFNEQYKDREMPYFGQDLFTKAQAKGPLTDKPYRDALAKNHRMSRKEGIDFVMDKNKLDALIAPTGGPAWTTHWVNGDHFTGGYSTASAGARYPHITLPAGIFCGFSVGSSVFWRYWDV